MGNPRDYCYAEFVPWQNSNLVFRLDTRIYLHDEPLIERTGGDCIAAIVAKNPGSARNDTYYRWEPVDLASDSMIPIVKKWFCEAFRESGKKMQPGHYVIVWNLFYLCNKTLGQAKKQYRDIPQPPVCLSEKSVSPRIVWFAWGGSDSELNSLKQRFIQQSYSEPFFYDYGSKRIQSRVPSETCKAKHTQGMLKSDVVRHLANILGSTAN